VKTWRKCLIYGLTNICLNRQLISGWWILFEKSNLLLFRKLYKNLFQKTLRKLA
jgi:hypothetical protein